MANGQPVNGYVTYRWLAVSGVGILALLFSLLQWHSSFPHLGAYPKAEAREDMRAMEARLNKRLDRMERKLDRLGPVNVRP